MNCFRLWAPWAERVEVSVAGSRCHLEPSEPSGWWSVTVADAAPGADYSFLLDGGDPLPDPRSPWQPEGVNGPSRLVDHSQFAWTDAGWQAPPLSSAIIYELHVGTFSAAGTFAGVAEHLDHLLELGVTHIELMPVAEFSGDWGWGYDGVDLFAPYHRYGEPDDLKRLVDTCHARGLAVLLDVVYNHLGPVGNYLGRFGPYFSGRHHTPWGAAINMDGTGSDEVRRFFCDNACMWLRDYHFDGLRLDAIHAIFDSSARHFLEQLADEVAELSAQTGRHFTTIAESDLNNPVVVMPRGVGGYGFDAQWSDDFHHALHTTLTGERAGYYADFRGLPDLAKAIEKAFVYDGQRSAYRGRVHGRPAGNLQGWRFLAYLQNHDQIGNRAQGDRSSSFMSVGQLKIAAALVLCSPFVPMLFQGEEFGASTPFQYFTQHPDPDVGRAVSEGRIREFADFGWPADQIPDPQDPRTFHRSKLDWSEADREPHTGLLSWHRRLIQLRRSTPSLSDGKLQAVRANFDQESGWLTVTRGSVVLAANFSPVNLTVPLPLEMRLTLASHELCKSTGKAVHLGPASVAILEAQ